MRLHDQVKMLKAQLKEAEEGIDALYNYAASDKFLGSFTDCMIHKNDIFLRLNETKQNILRAGYADYSK